MCGILGAMPPPDPEFPLRLLTLVRGNAIHSQILPEDQQFPPTVGISPHSRIASAIDLTKSVFLVSPRGRLAVTPVLVEDLHPDTVVYRRGDWMALGGGANQLIADQVTDLGNGAAFYEQHVRLENG